MYPTVCVPLGPGNTPAVERWQLVNVAQEDHNFHSGTCRNNPPSDNSNPIADWRSGVCTTTPITVEIAFTVAGDFVYHCHILEHEDGGMMARIRVRPN